MVRYVYFEVASVTSFLFIELVKPFNFGAFRLIK